MHDQAMFRGSVNPWCQMLQSIVTLIMYMLMICYQMKSFWFLKNEPRELCGRPYCLYCREMMMVLHHYIVKESFFFFHFECLIDRNEEYVLSSLCLKPNTMVCAHMIEWFEKILSTMLKKNKTRIDVGEWLVVRTVTWKTIYALTEMIKMLFTDQTGKTIKIGIWNQQQVLLHEG